MVQRNHSLLEIGIISYITTAICGILFIGAIIIWCHWFYYYFKLNDPDCCKYCRLFSKRPKLKRTHSTNYEEKAATLSTRIWITISMFLFITCIVSFFIDRILYYQLTRSDKICSIWMTIAMGSYTLANNAMFAYFAHRVCDILQSTAVAYRKSTVYIICCSIYIFVIAIVIFMIYIANSIISTSTSMGGTICEAVAVKKIGMYAFIDFWTLWAALTFMNIFYFIFTTWLLVRKLLQLARISLKLRISERILEIIKNPSEDDITGSDVDRFHRDTYRDNIFLILSTKLIIIMIVGTISTLITSIIFAFWTYSVLLMDSFINILLLWLNFKFAHKYFKIFKCGYSMQWIFPTIKTVSLISRNHLGCCCYLFCCCCLCCVGKHKINTPKHNRQSSRSIKRSINNFKHKNNDNTPSKTGKHRVVINGNDCCNAYEANKHISTNTMSSTKSIESRRSTKSIELSMSFNNNNNNNNKPKPITLSTKVQIASYSIETGKQNANELNINNNNNNNDEDDDDISKEIELSIVIGALESPDIMNNNLNNQHLPSPCLPIIAVATTPSRGDSRHSSRESSLSHMGIPGITPKLKPKLSFEYSNSKILDDETTVKRSYCCTYCCSKNGKNLYILARNEYDHFIKYKHN